jgi:hypothetical protein
MANAVLTTSTGVTASFGSTGAGSEGDPYILKHRTTPVVAAAANVHAPAANTAAVVTYASAGAGVCHVISGIHCAFDVAPAAAKALTVEDGSGIVVYKTFMTAAGLAVIPFDPPFKGSAATALIITLAASGSGSSTGVVSIIGHRTEPV